MTEFMKGKKDLQPSCSCLIECACLERQVPVWPGGELDKSGTILILEGLAECSLLERPGTCMYGVYAN